MGNVTTYTAKTKIEFEEGQGFPFKKVLFCEKGGTFSAEKDGDSVKITTSELSVVIKNYEFLNMEIMQEIQKVA